MSKIDWNSLPELLPRSEVLRITGWSKTGYTHVVKAGGLTLIKPPGYKQSRVRKRDLQRLVEGN